MSFLLKTVEYLNSEIKKYKISVNYKIGVTSTVLFVPSKVKLNNMFFWLFVFVCRFNFSKKLVFGVVPVQNHII